MASSSSIATPSSSTAANQPYRYNGKELDRKNNLDWMDYGARHFAGHGQWTSPDPLAEKYYDWSPYVYCVGNPIKFLDPDGRKVKPVGELAMSIIRNTVPQDARQYVILDDNGYLDITSMRFYNGISKNFKSLLSLVESEIDITVTTLQKTQFIQNGIVSVEYFHPVQIDEEFADNDFQNCSGNTTGEYGNLGVTYMPTHNEFGKASTINPNIIHININPSLSPIGAAETFSHEGYGHAVIYVETGGDREQAIHHPVDQKETNIQLRQKILDSRKETIKNMGI